MLDRNVRNMQHIWVVKSACKHVIHIYLLLISNKQKLPDQVLHEKL